MRFSNPLSSAIWSYKYSIPSKLSNVNKILLLGLVFYNFSINSYISSFFYYS